MLHIEKPDIDNPSFTADMEDGSRWSVFESPADFRRFTILTAAGAELVRKTEGRDALPSLMRQYMAAGIGGTILEGLDPQMHDELGRGQEAIVYRMGPYAVREESNIKGVYSALGALERMDAISTVIDHGLPRWLNLPAHYALYSDPESQKTYTVMDRIDGGLTVEDVVNYPDLSDRKIAVVEQELGGRIPDAQIQIPELYDRAHDILVEAIKGAGKDPKNYLTDWDPRNVVVQRFPAPVAGSDYDLNVIDQYRA